MITFIYGGSGSGKSAFAEDYICQTKYKNKYYLATMQAYDDEAKQRVNRHRSLREGKGFVTIEMPVDIVNAISEIDKNGDSIVLLECMSNLVANEMFKDGEKISCDECVDRIVAEVQRLAASVNQLVIVSNNIFEDGISYDEGTREYLRALGKINARLTKASDDAYEVVVGIGIKL